MEKALKPWVAAILSFLLPGLGFLYCGKTRTSILIYLCLLLVGNVSFAMIIFCDFKPFNIIIPAILSLMFYITVIVLSFKKAKAIKKVIISNQHLIYHKWFFYIFLIIFFGYAALVAVPIWSRYEAFKIPSTGMEDTLLVGDLLFADMYAYDDGLPNVNDVVVFIWPGNQQTIYLKRCVAIAGQTVELRDKILYVDGKIFPEKPMVKYTSAAGDDVRTNFGPFIVPDDNFFAIGDNRDNSYDSRYWGAVHKDYIMGKAVRIYWSPDFDRIGLKIE